MSDNVTEKSWQRRIKTATAKYLMGKTSQVKLKALLAEYERWKESARG